MTALDRDLMAEITGSLAGALGTIELALAVTEDEAARRALEAAGNVIATSHEHLSRVTAMVFTGRGEEKPVDPTTLVMGQPADDCQHLDLLGPFAGGALVCRDCAETIAPEEVGAGE